MNMEVTLDTVEAANDQIVVAVKYNVIFFKNWNFCFFLWIDVHFFLYSKQKARRKKFVCWLLLIVAFITLVLCIVLPIVLRNWKFKILYKYQK